jgi:hypothetical protein
MLAGPNTNPEISMATPTNTAKLLMKARVGMSMSIGSWLLVLFVASLSLFGSTDLLAQEAICVRVKIEIDQSVSLERQGFRATMKVNNGGAAELTGFKVAVNFADEQGNPVAATTNPNADPKDFGFFYELTSHVSLPNQIGAGENKEMVWRIVPTQETGGVLPAGKLYFVGARVSYTLDGVETVIDVQPDSIRVLPMPALALDYFLPNDVYGDDALTTQIEPVVPFNLGLRVRNNGAGPARRLQIESGQPRITENEQGLLIQFQILGSEINGAAATRSLLASFGDVAPGAAGVARWIMTSSLSGTFQSFSARFKHSDELGGQLTSLIPPDGIKTHRLIGDILVDLPGRDNIRDFLAKESGTGALKVFESQLLDAAVTDLSDEASIAPSGGGYTLTVPASVGFSYINLPDPSLGAKVVASVVRSDGRIINTNNAWIDATKVKNPNPVWNYRLHIFDADNTSGASYSVVLGDPPPTPGAPLLDVPRDVLVRVGETVQFPVRATHPDNKPVSVSIGALPSGAEFSPAAALAAQSAGQPVVSSAAASTADFTWTPGAGQTGTFPVQFAATDGTLSDRKTSFITVTEADGGLFANWKNRFWPGETNPSIIGDNADPDADGFDNLAEYALGLDPTVFSEEGGPDILRVEEGGQSYLALRYVRRTTDPALTFTVVGADSSTAPAAQWIAVGASIRDADQSGVATGFERVTARDTLPIDPARQKRFLRLKVGKTGGSTP